jgi:hypothetical protein
MKKLNADWLTHGLIDFEYKKYELLAYLQHVSRSFSEAKLYPVLADLIFHYNNIISIKKNKELLYEQFPGLAKGIDMKKLRIAYEKIIKDDTLMEELEEIMDFAIPRIEKAVKEGSEIYEYVESSVDISPIGLSPIYKDEGYVFILRSPDKSIKVYRYALKFFESASENYRSIETRQVEQLKYNRFKNLEKDKINLVKKYKDLPNPATYLVTSKNAFPYEETLLPVAKRFLVRYISTT